LQLVAWATAEAAAAHWASWAVNQEDNPWGSDEDDPTTAAAAAATAAAAAAAAASNGSSSAEALASAGDGVRGRWDYVIGLVGKPSAGKSTFFNAVTGEPAGLHCVLLRAPYLVQSLVSPLSCTVYCYWHYWFQQCYITSNTTAFR
jgi:hypothetical protein